MLHSRRLQSRPLGCSLGSGNDRVSWRHAPLSRERQVTCHPRAGGDPEVLEHSLVSTSAGTTRRAAHEAGARCCPALCCAPHHFSGPRANIRFSVCCQPREGRNEAIPVSPAGIPGRVRRVRWQQAIQLHPGGAVQERKIGPVHAGAGPCCAARQAGEQSSGMEAHHEHSLAGRGRSDRAGNVKLQVPKLADSRQNPTLLGENKEKARPASSLRRMTCRRSSLSI